MSDNNKWMIKFSKETLRMPWCYNIKWFWELSENLIRLTIITSRGMHCIMYSITQKQVSTSSLNVRFTILTLLINRNLYSRNILSNHRIIIRKRNFRAKFFGRSIVNVSFSKTSTYVASLRLANNMVRAHAQHLCCSRFSTAWLKWTVVSLSHIFHLLPLFFHSFIPFF